MGENQSSKHKELTDKIREEKQKPKGPIKFQLQLNEEQKVAKEKILNNAVTVLSGKAGSGKTLLACQIALDLLFKKVIQKIVITRPTVSKEEIGFLPGDLREKMEPWMQPIYANFYQLYNKEKIDEILESGVIEIVPVAFMRGRTFLDSFVIVDEAQNCTTDQMEMIVSRLGLRSKMVICGDTQQVDLKTRGESGFKFLISVASKVKDMASQTLLTNHRHPIVDALLDEYEYLKQITNGNGKKVYAVWCGPCRMLAPVMNEIKSKYPNVKFEEYDVDNEVDEVMKYGVTSVPTVIIEKNGQLHERFTGLQSKMAYQNSINEAIG